MAAGAVKSSMRELGVFEHLSDHAVRSAESIAREIDTESRSAEPVARHGHGIGSPPKYSE